MGEGIHSTFCMSFEQVCSQDSCGVMKVLKNVVQISSPIQHNGTDCGLFAVVICLHIFDGAEVGPHIFTQLRLLN